MAQDSVTANKFDDVEPLSLSTFDDKTAKAPYLNTPRSLEACRRFGVNPVELVELSVDEFRRQHPDDPDTAQRRYERIEGARRRLMTNIMVEWKTICDEGWTPEPARPATAKESILNVRPAAHSRLLELQAEKFRKIEQDQFNALQRMLTITVKKADQEVKNNAIMQKHAEIAAKGNEREKAMQKQKEELFRQQMQRKKEKEEAEAIRIKQLQEMDAQEAREKMRKHEEKLKKERLGREARERDRLNREQYTKDLKETIMKQLNQKASQKQKLADMKAKESAERKAANEAERNRINNGRKRAQQARQEKARIDAMNAAETARQEMLDRITADDAKRNRLFETRQQEREGSLDAINREKEERRKRQKADSDNAARQREEKIKAELKFKDMLAQQELEKVRQAQERRRTIKSIRQEAYDIAAARQHKADEYKKKLAKQAIKDKNDKCKAIQDGFKTLSQMRNSMKDIMTRATVALKGEIHNLEHKNELSPEKVISRSLKVSNRELFPKLKQKFGLVEPLAAAEEARIAAMTVDESSMTASGGNVTAPGSPTAQKGDRGRAQTAGATPKKRDGVTLPIYYMNENRLRGTLSSAHRKIEEEDAARERERESRSPSPKRGGSPTTKSPKRGGTDYEDPFDSKYADNVGKSPSKGNGRDKKPPQIIKGGMKSHKTTFIEEGQDEFRREYSGDHPLAPGGTGKYKEEKSTGKKPVTVKKMSTTDKNTMTPQDASKSIAKLSMTASHPVVDPEKQLEQLRREQNEALIRVLQEEKAAEEKREAFNFGSINEHEQARMEIVFAEERRRASERIVKLTKEHEERIKEAVLAMMSLKKHKSLL
jgi:hypothetical protein